MTDLPIYRLPVVSEDPERPVKRGDCFPTRHLRMAKERDRREPCVWVSCRYHLLLDVTDGKIRVNDAVRSEDVREAMGGPSYWSLNDDDVATALHDLPHSCALDVADMSGTSEYETGRAMGITQQGVVKLINSALRKLKRNPLGRELIRNLLGR